MVIFVFGNPDLKMDSLPIKILPELKKKFLEIEFKVVDPNEEWEVPQELVIIDTVVGIKEIKIFDNLKDFVPAPNITMHDFDAYANLRFLEKLGKLKKVKIIGVPSELSEEQALSGIADIINRIYKRRKKLRFPDFDYSKAGYYFVTICTKDRKCLFGEIINGKMRLNELGKIVDRAWKQILKYYKDIGIDEFVIMPNHLHGIIVINENVGAINNRPYRYDIDDPDVGAINNRPYRYGLLSKIVKSFKSVVAKEIKQNLDSSFQWHRSYYDHVVRDEKSLEKIREYIQNNPLQWELDEENPKNWK